MIGIGVASPKEWEVVLDKFNVDTSSCKKYPFGEYFITEIDNNDIIFYSSGVRKMNASSAAQYMIDHFDLKRIIAIGTCAGIDDRFKPLDIFIPNKAVQYDCTVKEIEPFIKDSFTILFDLELLEFEILTGTIGTADKPVVMWNDYLELKENGITIADTESAAIAYVCKANNIECVIIKGISDFPMNNQDISKELSYEKQLNTFLTNIPIVMNKIIDEYLIYAINANISYNIE